MRLVSIIEFRRLVYSPESAPCLNTLRNRIREKLIPGGRMDCGHYFIDMDEYDTATRMSQRLAERRQELSKRPELQGLL